MLPEHLDQVMAIELKSFPIPWSHRTFMFEVTENDFAFYIVALLNGRVAGYAGMWIVLDEAHVTNVAVHPELRGRGVGRALMTELLGRAAVLGADRITLEVRVSNRAARSLYKSLGFVEKGLRRKYYSDNNEDAVIMWLHFKQTRH
ncbi:MAG: ribosomal protein S18-alanine N-acetyltransferase [Peptococcaceae bacterium]|nr:ribosomal protein S18-alanine N-acetyltransferase [Peptococcaceae bacterium]